MTEVSEPEFAPTADVGNAIATAGGRATEPLLVYADHGLVYERGRLSPACAQPTALVRCTALRFDVLHRTATTRMQASTAVSLVARSTL